MKLVITTVCCLYIFFLNAQIEGKWKIVSSTVEFGGEKTEMHKALLSMRPCVDKIYYAINADGTYRLHAKESGCDQKYISIQEKLYSETKWKIENDHILISATDFAISKKYKFNITGKKMTWIGTDGEGTTVYEKL